MALRGAGDRDARQLTEHLDSLGLARVAGVATLSTRFASAALAENVMQALPAYADIVRRPLLHEEGFAPSRDLAIQGLEGLQDNPQQMAMIELKQYAWPGPLSRNPMGSLDHLDKLTADAIRHDYSERWRPGGCVLALAGNVDFDRVIKDAEQLFGDWEPFALDALEITPPPGKFRFVDKESEQTHIALAYPTLGETSDDYYHARLAIEVLSGGMSGRLMSEIREKRGLCYSVYASYASLSGPELPASLRGDLASVFCYAGSSNDRAQATLDALVAELRRLPEGITANELLRARTGLKAGIVMSGESSSACAGALVRDWTTRRRLRTLDEIIAAIDAVTVDSLNTWLAANPPGDFTTVLIGPKPLNVPE